MLDRLRRFLDARVARAREWLRPGIAWLDAKLGQLPGPPGRHPRLSAGLALGLAVALGGGVLLWAAPASSEGIQANPAAFAEPPRVNPDELHVVQGTPRGEVSVNDLQKEIVVVFNHPLQPLGVLDQQKPCPLRVSPQPPGQFRWYGSRVCAFVPKEMFRPGAVYSVKVPAGTKALNGKTLVKEYAFSFQTPPLELQYPRNASGGRIGYEERFSFQFNYAVGLDEFRKTVSFQVNGRDFPFQASYPRDDDGDARPARTLLEEREGMRSIELRPARKLPRDAPVRIALPGSLKPLDGNRGLSNPSVFTYQTYGPLTVELRNEARFFQDLYRTRLDFSTPVLIADIQKYIRLEPAAELGPIGADQLGSISIGDWRVEPGKTYSITIDPAIQDVYGNKFQGTNRFSVQTPRYRREFYTESDVQAVEAKLDQRAPVFVAGMASIGAGVAEFDRGDVLKYAASGYEQRHIPYGSVERTEWKTGLGENSAGRPLFDFKPFLNENGRGWRTLILRDAIETYRGESKERVQIRSIQSTDLGLTVKRGPDASVAFVHSLSDAKPRKGVRIEAYDGHTRLGACETDASGSCNIKHDVWPNQAVYFAEDRDQGDQAFVLARDHAMPMWSVADDYRSNAAAADLLGQIVFDRKLYRPGDTAEIKGVLALRQNGALHTDRLHDVKLSVHNAKGELIHSANLDPSDEGGVWSSVAIPADAPRGHYNVRISASVPGEDESRERVMETFQVEDFRVVNFTVESEGFKDARAGQMIPAVVSARYLFGAPMGEAPLEYNLSRKPHGLTFDQWQGYVFDDFDGGERWQPRSFSRLSGGEARLDARGEFKLEIQAERYPGEETPQDNLHRSYQLELEAKVTDVDDTTIAHTRTATIRAADRVPGLRPARYYQSKNRPLEADVVLVDANSGQPVAGAVTVVARQKEWKTIQSSGPGGSVQRKNMLVRTEVFRKRVNLGAASQTIAFQPREPGEYALTVYTDDGAYARTRLFIYGGGYSGWDFRNDDTIELRPDQNEYAPGDTAKVLVQSPFQRSQAIVTLEREGVLWQKSFELEGNGEPLEIPIKEEYAPNVFVSVMLIRPRIPDDASGANESGDASNLASPEEDMGRPRFKIGVAKLSVDTASKRLPLRFTLDRKRYGPGDRAKLVIETTPRAEVALSIADRAVLDLVNYRYRDPVRIFYNNWPLGVDVIENRRTLIQQISYALKGQDPGGKGAQESVAGDGGFDEEAEDGSRTNFRYTAEWKPALIADDDGRIELELELPDNLTTWRIQALAARAGNYASAQHEFEVQKPLVIQPALPRFLRPGDELVFSAVLIQRAGKSGDFEVALESELLEFADGAQKKTVRLNDGEAREVVFRVRLNETLYLKKRAELVQAYRAAGRNAEQVLGGVVEIQGRFRAKPVNAAAFPDFARDQIQDAMTFQVPVIEQPPSEAFTIAGVAEPKSEEFLELPRKGRVLPVPGGLEVSMASTALVGADQAFRFFSSNPYFCLEQRASAYLSAIAAGAMLDGFANRPPQPEGYDFKGVRALFLEELSQFQNSDGGFRAWKDGAEISRPYLTAYVLFVLQNARELDSELSLDQSVYNRAMGYLRKYREKPDKDGWSYVLETLALSQYVLARDDSADASAERFLLEQRQRLSLRGHAYLALAIALRRDAERAAGDKDLEAIFGHLRNRMEVQTRRITFKEPSDGAYTRAYYARGSTLAMILQAFTQLETEHPLLPQLVRHSIQNQGRLWGDSHSAGLLALALRNYRERFESETPDFTGVARFQGKTLASESFEGRTLKLAVQNLSMQQTLALGEPGERAPFVFERQGDAGRLYYTATLEYAPILKDVEARDEGLEVRREVLALAAPEGERAWKPDREMRYTRGELYLYRVTVISPKPVFDAVIEDPLPANMEAVIADFATESARYARFLEEQRRGDDSGYWWMGASPRYEYRTDRVLVTESYLSPGIHEYFYLARALSRGEAAAPAARAFAMYEPEIFGRTAGGTQTVR